MSYATIEGAKPANIARALLWARKEVPSGAPLSQLFAYASTDCLAHFDPHSRAICVSLAEALKAAEGAE